MLTCDPQIGEDLTELFNFSDQRSGYTAHRKLLPALRVLKQTPMDEIAREISRHREDTPGLISSR